MDWKDITNADGMYKAAEFLRSIALRSWESPLVWAAHDECVEIGNALAMEVAPRCPECRDAYPTNDLDMSIAEWGCESCEGKVACASCSRVLDYDDAHRLNESGDLCCQACKTQQSESSADSYFF
jgi:uncharacterized protein YbaR (Trm112 family)